ncbi:hypothetical protein SAMN00120144_4202 [Hymenobacter roseosalivarius DSM 11622]|uniref:Uncharacterized protein n=1 Tax=Hymenobacter roseosalivarius DSM 11622 TaxID=645990 RepID=A0A1W1UIB3_9BACT|nr:hypothetical protein SAMN00120144_4202 [Hymenobacter roseosalivarius DSM 11622]
MLLISRVEHQLLLAQIKTLQQQVADKERLIQLLERQATQ